MILDTLAVSRVAYDNMDARLAKAFDWLRSTDLAAVPLEGKVAIDGERIFAMGQTYETLDASKCAFEAHRNYIDIQMMTHGTEVMYWAPLAEMGAVTSPYDYDRDVVKFAMPAFSVPVPVRAGDFAVFFPSDGHMPRCAHGAPETIRKIVVKIAV